ncbi:hypothetical protein EGH22_16650 [Halomicroarcula sp. F28]|uniref:hypothetical protein n=1 Tax=Haloarcula salinisoli TaxID=2487746 RepID=UPI001C7336E2|nr:hypothetical protein [Halomicroarcula salinisoli]MBX0287964.1 hypothetical protein [Halomicroarcula salinisoli]
MSVAKTTLQTTRPDRLDRGKRQHSWLTTPSHVTDPNQYAFEDMWADIQDGDVGLTTPPFIYDIGGIYVIGKPTFLRFNDGRPTELTQLRGVTNDDYLDQIFPNEWFRLWCYGSLLDRVGFDVSNLSIRFLKYPQSTFDAPKILNAELLISNNSESVSIPLDDVGNSVYPELLYQHPFKYEQDAEKGQTLRSFLALWRDGGEPSAANHWKQCQGCRFREECTLALQPE